MALDVQQQYLMQF